MDRIFKILAICLGFLSLCITYEADAQNSNTESCSATADNASTNVYQYPYNSSSPGNILTCGSIAVSDILSPIYGYMGIQYASSNRWQNSTLLDFPGSGQPVSQVAPGDVCPQWGKDPNSNSNGDSNSQVILGNENCLYLNIWTPKINMTSADTKLPVMLFIHGGAFVVGAGSLSLYDGSALAKAGNIVVVTINYRLGALGFLASWDSAKKQTVIGGNFGLSDQQNAMQWVKNNIANFGGDPNQITLAGESAGAMSVGLHTFAIPSSSSYFSQAIMESNPLGLSYLTPQASFTDHGSAFLNNLCAVWTKRVSGPKVSNISCNPITDPNQWTAKSSDNKIDINVSTDDILNAQLYPNSGCSALNLSVCGSELSNISLTWNPVLDGTLVQGQPINGYVGTNQQKPILIGTNLNEGNLFLGSTLNKHSFLTGLLTSTKPYVAIGTYNIIALAITGSEAPLNSKRYQPGSYADITFTDPSDNTNNINFSAQEQALAQLISDYIFNCPNYYALSKIATSTSTIYAYQFQQEPFFDLYSPNDAYLCYPTMNTSTSKTVNGVCHGNELPYVFNTLGVAVKAGFNTNTSDPYLAHFMTGLWARFVNKNMPSQVPVYSTSASSPVVQLVYTGTTKMQDSDLTTTNVSDTAVCNDVWKSIIQKKFGS